MYDIMDRSAMKALRKRGYSYTKIALELDCDRRTVSKILNEPIEKRYDTNSRKSEAADYKEQIFEWFDKKVPVKRMFEMLREDQENPYKSGKSAFYVQVRKFKTEWKRGKQESIVRFEGLPSEYVQIDWGEVRDFPFLRQMPEKRYFFAARLKYSRFSYVEFQKDMKLETLIRCMLRAFEVFGGVPWVAVFDNIKTVTIGRDEKKKPIWNETFIKFAAEIDIHPEVCWLYSAQQKGSVENLVGWVKSNFLHGREFLNDTDLSYQCSKWLDTINNSVSQAHGQIPSILIQEEKAKFLKLCTKASEYGIFRQSVVGPESLVRIENSRYSVPVGFIGEALETRIREEWVEFYKGTECVSRHKRNKNQYKPFVLPEHFEPAFEKKPRARIMLYRDFLIEQDTSIKAFTAELCRRCRGEFADHILKMYELWQEYGTEDLGIACALASEYGAYGSDYLVSVLKKPCEKENFLSIDIDEIPVQDEIDRILSEYEVYVMGGAA